MDYHKKSELIGELNKAMKDEDTEEIEERVNFKNTGTLEIHKELSLDNGGDLNEEQDEDKVLEAIMAKVAEQRKKKE